MIWSTHLARIHCPPTWSVLAKITEIFFPPISLSLLLFLLHANIVANETRKKWDRVSLTADRFVMTRGTRVRLAVATPCAVVFMSIFKFCRYFRTQNVNWAWMVGKNNNNIACIGWLVVLPPSPLTIGSSFPIFRGCVNSMPNIGSLESCSISGLCSFRFGSSAEAYFNG